MGEILVNTPDRYSVLQFQEHDKSQKQEQLVVPKVTMRLEFSSGKLFSSKLYLADFAAEDQPSPMFTA